MNYARIILLLLMLPLNGIILHAQGATETYCNERYSYCLKYFPALLKPQPVAGNGDGRTFSDAAGKEKLSVYGTGDWTYTTDGSHLTLKALYQRELSGGPLSHRSGKRVITYQTLKGNWFILSGTERGEIFYLKVVKREDAFCYARLHYLPAETAIYKQTALLIAKEFH